MSLPCQPSTEDVRERGMCNENLGLCLGMLCEECSFSGKNIDPRAAQRIFLH